MNIQDIISTIINYVKNMDKKDLVIFILIALLFYRTRNVEGNENVAIDDSTLNSSHLAAIRNLGNLAKSLQDGNNIVLPGDVQIDGELTVNNTIYANKDSDNSIVAKGTSNFNMIKVNGSSNFDGTIYANREDTNSIIAKGNLTVDNHTHTKTVLVDGSANFDGTIYANRDDDNSNSIVAKGTANFNMIVVNGSSNFDGTIYANRSDASAIYSRGNIVAEKNNEDDTFPFFWKIPGDSIKKLKWEDPPFGRDYIAIV